MVLFVYSGKFSRARLWRDFLLACLPTALFFVAVASQSWRGPAIVAMIALPFAWSTAAAWVEARRRRRNRITSARR